MAKMAFEKLDVYRLAEELSDEVWDLVERWKPLARDTVGKQAIRAADSIGANVAEGTGRGSSRDNCRFIRIARGSLYETTHWLRRAYRRRLLTQPQVKRLQALLSELGPRLNAYLTAISGSKPGLHHSNNKYQITNNNDRATKH
jgi:four helix bundle protein